MQLIAHTQARSPSDIKINLFFMNIKKHINMKESSIYKKKEKNPITGKRENTN